MPQPSAEHHEGLDFDFDWDLEAQNANLFGAESENEKGPVVILMLQNGMKGMLKRWETGRKVIPMVCLL